MVKLLTPQYQILPPIIKKDTRRFFLLKRKKTKNETYKVDSKNR